MSKFVETHFGGTKEILKFPDHYVALAVTVDDDGIEANENGKKIIPKGTVVGGKTKSVIDNDEEPVVGKVVVEEEEYSATGAEGVLLNDVDVTHGPAPGAMVIHGFIAIDKLPYEDNDEAVDAVRAVVNGIKFIR